MVLLYGTHKRRDKYTQGLVRMYPVCTWISVEPRLGQSGVGLRLGGSTRVGSVSVRLTSVVVWVHVVLLQTTIGDPKPTRQLPVTQKDKKRKSKVD